MKLFLRHPIVIFVVGGACIFALDQKLRWTAEAPVTLSAAEIDGLRKDLHQRGETRAEAFEAAHQAALDEAILVHEARRLGLAEDDPIVRRRLAQVMRFFLLEQHPIAEPTQAQLETHLRQHKPRYQQPRRVSFEHHFFAGKDAIKSALADIGNVPSTLIAIFFASFPYWLVRQPSELLKVRGQTALGEEELPGGVAGLVTGLRDSLRLLDVRKAVVRERLYQGFGSNVAYTFPADAIKFVAYDYLKAEVKKKTNSKPDGLQAAVLGALASMAAQAATTPLDVARNRIMNSAQAATTASGSVGLARTGSAESDAAKDIARGRDYAGETSLSAMVRIYREEGAGSLMLGLTPRLLRAVLSGALQFSTYEFTKGKVSK